MLLTNVNTGMNEENRFKAEIEGALPKCPPHRFLASCNCLLRGKWRYFDSIKCVL